MLRNLNELVFDPPPLLPIFAADIATKTFNTFLRLYSGCVSSQPSTPFLTSHRTIWTAKCPMAVSHIYRNISSHVVCDVLHLGGFTQTASDCISRKQSKERGREREERWKVSSRVEMISRLVKQENNQMFRSSIYRWNHFSTTNSKHSLSAASKLWEFFCWSINQLIISALVWTQIKRAISGHHIGLWGAVIFHTPSEYFIDLTINSKQDRLIDNNH